MQPTKGVNYTMGHILLEKTFIYPEPLTIKEPANCSYDEVSGYWKTHDGNAAIMSESFRAGETKKCDIETGEDQKGE